MLQHGTMALAAIAKPYECRCSLVLLDVEARRGGLIGPNILYESQISGAGASLETICQGNRDGSTSILAEGSREGHKECL